MGMPSASAAFLLVLSAIAAGLRAAAPAAQAALDPVTIAVVSMRDGRYALQPIARFTGLAWVNTWPALEEGAPVPTVGQVPEAWLGGQVPAEWHFWPREGPKRLARIAAVERRESICPGPAELIFEQGGAPARAGAAGFGGAGVAATRNVIVDQLTDVPLGSAEAARLFDAIRRAFRAGERETVAAFRWFDNLLTPAMLSDGRLQPITVELLMRPAGAAMARTYFFDAMRRVQEDQVHGIARSGWIRADGSGNPVVFGETGRVMWEMQTGVNRTPLAVLRVSDLDLWILRESFYEGVGYSLVEVGPLEVVERATANGGGC